MIWSPDQIELGQRVCAEYGVALEDVRGALRHRSLSDARLALYWALRTQAWPPLSYPDIGRLMGRDHTTVIVGIRAHLERTRGRVAKHVDATGELARCTADPFPRRCAG